MSDYQLTELALDDLEEIRDRVLSDNGPIVARRIILELKTKLELLCEFPRMGRVRPDLTEENVFFFPFYSWLIVYEPDTQPLMVVRLISSYRNPKNFLL
jgi:antitoxin ParD1/3/4/toxin ParE1/3/4